MLNLKLLCLFCFILLNPVLSRIFNNGYYGDYPAYRSDTPSKYHYKLSKLIPYGLPKGGLSKKGIPFGLIAYAAKLGGWKPMKMKYQKSRFIEKAYKNKLAW